MPRLHRHRQRDGGGGTGNGIIPDGGITGSGTNDFSRTQPSAVVLGAPNGTQNLSFTFSQAVTNPYLFFTFVDSTTSFTFTQPFVLAQANNATASGQTVTGTGGTDPVNDGFVVRFSGTYSTINFAYNNPLAGTQTVGFTAGGANFVPAPLPLMGAGVAFGFSRRLRRRIQSVV